MYEGIVYIDGSDPDRREGYWGRFQVVPGGVIVAETARYSYDGGDWTPNDCAVFIPWHRVGLIEYETGLFGEYGLPG